MSRTQAVDNVVMDYLLTDFISKKGLLEDELPVAARLVRYAVAWNKEYPSLSGQYDQVRLSIHANYLALYAITRRPYDPSKTSTFILYSIRAVDTAWDFVNAANEYLKAGDEMIQFVENMRQVLNHETIKSILAGDDYQLSNAVAGVASEVDLDATAEQPLPDNNTSIGDIEDLIQPAATATVKTPQTESFQSLIDESDKLISALGQAQTMDGHTEPNETNIQSLYNNWQALVKQRSSDTKNEALNSSITAIEAALHQESNYKVLRKITVSGERFWQSSKLLDLTTLKLPQEEISMKVMKETTSEIIAKTLKKPQEIADKIKALVDDAIKYTHDSLKSTEQETPLQALHFQILAWLSQDALFQVLSSEVIDIAEFKSAVTVINAWKATETWNKRKDALLTATSGLVIRQTEVDPKAAATAGGAASSNTVTNSTPTSPPVGTPEGSVSSTDDDAEQKMREGAAQQAEQDPHAVPKSIQKTPPTNPAQELLSEVKLIADHLQEQSTTITKDKSKKIQSLYNDWKNLVGQESSVTDSAELNKMISTIARTLYQAPIYKALQQIIVPAKSLFSSATQLDLTPLTENLETWAMAKMTEIDSEITAKTLKETQDIAEKIKPLVDLANQNNHASLKGKEQQAPHQALKFKILKWLTQETFFSALETSRIDGFKTAGIAIKELSENPDPSSHQGAADRNVTIPPGEYGGGSVAEMAPTLSTTDSTPHSVPADDSPEQQLSPVKKTRQIIETVEAICADSQPASVNATLISAWSYYKDASKTSSATEEENKELDAAIIDLQTVLYSNDIFERLQNITTQGTSFFSRKQKLELKILTKNVRMWATELMQNISINIADTSAEINQERAQQITALASRAVQYDYDEEKREGITEQQALDLDILIWLSQPEVSVKPDKHSQVALGIIQSMKEADAGAWNSRVEAFLAKNPTLRTSIPSNLPQEGAPLAVLSVWQDNIQAIDTESLARLTSRLKMVSTPPAYYQKDTPLHEGYSQFARLLNPTDAQAPGDCQSLVAMMVASYAKSYIENNGESMKSTEDYEHYKALYERGVKRARDYVNEESKIDALFDSVQVSFSMSDADDKITLINIVDASTDRLEASHVAEQFNKSYQAIYDLQEWHEKTAAFMMESRITDAPLNGNQHYFDQLAAFVYQLPKARLLKVAGEEALKKLPPEKQKALETLIELDNVATVENYGLLTNSIGEGSTFSIREEFEKALDFAEKAMKTENSVENYADNILAVLDSMSFLTAVKEKNESIGSEQLKLATDEQITRYAALHATFEEVKGYIVSQPDLVVAQQGGSAEQPNSPACTNEKRSTPRTPDLFAQLGTSSKLIELSLDSGNLFKFAATPTDEKSVHSSGGGGAHP